MLTVICRRILSYALYNCRTFSSTKWSSSIPGGELDMRGDGAFRRKQPLDSTIEQTYAGALSFLC
jgi:hypothetical protein